MQIPILLGEITPEMQNSRCLTLEDEEHNADNFHITRIQSHFTFTLLLNFFSLSKAKLRPEVFSLLMITSEHYVFSS